MVKKSFFKHKNILTINNGIDVNIFKPTDNNTDIRSKLNLNDEKIIIGVASVWTYSKGLDDFIKLDEMLSSKYKIILVGLSKKQISRIPTNIIGIERTESVQQLAELYNIADVFVNPTYADNFPTTNIESLACGTPIITYKTGGSPESVDNKTGMVVEQGNLNDLKVAIEKITSNKSKYSDPCRAKAVMLYNKQDRFNDYINLFNSLLK